MAEEGSGTRLMHGDDTLSPVDLPGSQVIGGAPVLWTSVVIGVAALSLLLTNAVTIDGWAKELPPSPMAERVTELSGGWVAITDRFGLGAPRAAVHGRWKQAEAAEFVTPASRSR